MERREKLPRSTVAPVTNAPPPIRFAQLFLRSTLETVERRQRWQKFVELGDGYVGEHEHGNVAGSFTYCAREIGNDRNSAMP